MILHLNHTRRDAAVAGTNETVAAVLSLLEEKHLTPGDFARLQIHLDWLQYKHNFREAVTITQDMHERSGGPSVMEIRIDSRQVAAGSLREPLQRALGLASGVESGRVYFEEFQSLRSSIVWEFNRLYWHRLKDWERATGKGYEKALPGGVSDGHQPEAISASVEEFLELLKDLEKRNQLPPELFILEIGVGTGTRAGLWLDRFRELDRARGTGYYPRLRFLLGDYSLATLERSRPAVKNHIDLCSFIAVDALDPIKTLSFLRHKILHVHSTNMYDNLPDEELVWRDNRIYWVQMRAYLSPADAAQIGTAFDIPASDITKVARRLLDVGPECLPDRNRGLAFWQEIWKAMRLEERLVRAEDLPDSSLPAGLSVPQMEDILKEAPSDLRFHLSSGALESFRNTLPLLHPQGYLQVQDIFVTDLNEYDMGFHGPGKFDGSIVSWVNGTLLREVGERSGYNLHFTPFKYGAGSNTSVLYTTRRE
ncbi:MAG: hypothetical protein ABR953_12410 [Candidatus Acidiferrales bacterium]|jgi:hypothetical protein